MLDSVDTARALLNAALLAGTLTRNRVRQGQDSPLACYTLHTAEAANGRIFAEVYDEHRRRFVGCPNSAQFYILARRDRPAWFYRVNAYPRALRLAAAWLGMA